jgi:hypothetical protein
LAHVGETGTDERLTAAVLRGRRHLIRSRVTRLHATHTYRSVLALVFATFVFSSLAGDEGWSAGILLVLQAATLAAALWTTGLVRADSKLAIALLVAATITATALAFTGGHVVVAVAGLASGALIVATIAVIAIGVVDQHDVNAQSITGAICIYILLGILFVFLFSAAALLGSGDFFVQGTDGTRSLRFYFSFVTLATLGYGDYTPAGNLGHMLAVLEALVGQLYLVTVLALLVSRLRGHAPRDGG